MFQNFDTFYAMKFKQVVKIHIEKMSPLKKID